MEKKSKMQSVLSFVSRYKYWVVVVVGLAVILVFDENSLYVRWQHHRTISELKSEIAKYKKQFESDTQQLKDLESNPKAIERIARERYFMKADDEDIFVLSTDLEEVAPAEDQTETPADSQTETPADNQPQTPADNQPQTPGGAETGEPGSEKPAQDAGTPSDPEDIRS
jgi:cell division protein FtsB